MILARPRMLLLVAALAACGTAGGPSPRDVAPAGSTLTGEAWAEQTLARLSLRQKVAQMVVPWLDGAYLALGTEAHERLRAWVQDQQVGGVVVSVGPPLEIAAKLNLLQELAEVPLLVAADVERGPAQRLVGGTVLPYGIETGGGTDFPPIMALGAIGDERLAYEVGRITALESRAVGIHMAYAPVVDVNNNPANPIINTRSYGEDPRLVARLGVAHIKGLQENGVLATAKHFPGHGNTSTDSHIGLPVLPIDRAGADSVELPPFRAAIEAGVAAVMVAHVAFPAIAGDSTPATLSPELTNGLLRDALGFDGLIVTDALDMGAITTRYGAAEAAVRAVKAGADVLLMPLDVAATIDAVVAAVERGEIPESRIDRSVRKLLRIKGSLGLHRERTVDLAKIPNVVGSPAHQAVAREVAERSITLVRDRDRLLPVSPLRARRVLSIVYTDDVDPFAGRVFNRELASRYGAVRSVLLDRSVHPTRLDSLMSAVDSADVVFISSFIRVIDRKGGLAVPPAVAKFVSAVAAKRPTVVTSFGNPYILSQFPGVGTYAVAWGPAAVAQTAAARAIAGEIPFAGKLPISLPPDHPLGSGIPMENTLRFARPEEVGMDSEALAKVDRLLTDAVTGGAIPGAALAVGRHGRLVRLQGYGRLDPRPGFGPVTDSTLYDLASLTKVIGTTSAAILLVDEGKLDLDAPVSRYLPEWTGGGGKERVTIRHLLTHTSGLPAYGPLWQELRGREAYLRRIAAMGLEAPPGQRMVYSDYGLILLGLIIERLADRPLDEFLEARVFGPLGMRDTRYDPLGEAAAEAARGIVAKGAGGPGAANAGDRGGDALASVSARPAEKAASAELLARIAPTEIDSVFRMKHIHGAVHDENAYAIGGVSGHAGLFSSARDLAVFAQMVLNGGSYGGVRIFNANTLRRFTARQDSRSSRALGWDTPSKGSSAGDYFSARSFGHTGFTGTSIWIDPERDVFVVLLTNRVNPTRANQAHVALRRAVHDAVQQAIVDQPVVKRIDKEP
jgi:beta-glucosidase-like glycosyl hydrolase/CubicO group peptidase (beta-lactamase class C family)